MTRQLCYILVLLMGFSCSNVSYNQLAGHIDISVKAELEANITVGDNISGTGSETVVFFIFRWPGTKYRAEGSTMALDTSSPSTFKIPILSNTLNSLNPFNVVEHAKGQAIHNAITSSNADVIINPKFIITEQDFFFYKTVKCEVSGKKGTIKTIK